MKASFAEMLPRLYKLKNADPNPSHPDTYFKRMEVEKKLEHPLYLERFQKLEQTLGQLDDVAWADLRERALPQLSMYVESRAWQSLFDTLNEAKGYVHLRNSGCTDIAFIKRTKQKTPDLRAVNSGARVLCEVKTINISQDEANWRTRIAHGEVLGGSVATRVMPELLKKVSDTLQQGIAQLDGADPQRTARRLVFAVLTFDDSIGDYQPEYIAQIDAHLCAEPIVGAELVFCPAHNLFEHHRFAMRSATVVEV